MYYSLCAASVIAEFAQKLLNDDLPSKPSSKSNHLYAVIGAYVFVCRQMYNTCDGLLLLSRYNLHKAVAAAWRQVSG